MKNLKGFTVIELVIVVAIVSILSGITVTFFGGKLKDKAIASEAVSMLGVVESACRLFTVQNGYGPAELTDLTDAGLVSVQDLNGTFFSSEEIDRLVGDGSIPLGDRGLKNGCGTVNGITICKVETGGYSISGSYNR